MLTLVCRTKISKSLYSKQIDAFFMKYMSNNILKKFGKRVRQERVKQNLSQEELAEKAGVHRTYIGMVERAEKNITLQNIEKIAKALKTSINNLMKLEK